MPETMSRAPKAPTDEIGTISTVHENGGLTVTLAGRWNVPTVMATEVAMRAIRANPGETASIDVSGITLLDTVGAISICRLRSELAEVADAQITGAKPAQAALLDQIATVDAQPIPPRPNPTTLDHVAELGKWTIQIGYEARELIGFFGELAVVIGRLVLHPGRIRITSITSHMQAVGINAMPIVGLLAFLVGVVLTFISGDQLQRFGANIYIVNLIGVGVLRELGILITAIIVAGRSGSAFTAEIGTMKINQEVDAMRTIGLDPMEILVIPRTIALILMILPLGFFADIVMIGGGALMANLSLGVSFPQFINQFQSAIGMTHLWAGFVKAPFFAFVIALVGCFHGLKVAGSAESVGQETTQSVVESIFLVIALDAIFAVIFWQIDW